MSGRWGSVTHRVEVNATRSLLRTRPTCTPRAANPCTPRNREEQRGQLARTGLLQQVGVQRVHELAEFVDAPSAALRVVESTCQRPSAWRHGEHDVSARVERTVGSVAGELDIQSVSGACVAVFPLHYLPTQWRHRPEPTARMPSRPRYLHGVVDLPRRAPRPTSC